MTIHINKKLFLSPLIEQMRPTKKSKKSKKTVKKSISCFLSKISKMFKQKGGVAEVNRWPETSQPSEAIMQRATTAGGTRRQRRSQKKRH